MTSQSPLATNQPSSNTFSQPSVGLEQTVSIPQQQPTHIVQSQQLQQNNINLTSPQNLVSATLQASTGGQSTDAITQEILRKIGLGGTSAQQPQSPPQTVSLVAQQNVTGQIVQQQNINVQISQQQQATQQPLATVAAQRGNQCSSA